MKIAFIGKGGSGKTTATGLVTHHMSKNNNVISIDADINQQLSELLQITHTKENIGNVITKITKYLHNNRSDIESKYMIGTTPPTKNSRFIQNNKDDEFLKRYSTRKNNIKFLRVGTYETKDMGSNCYHTKLASLELFLHHSKESQNEYILVDSTAGIDILGTSLYVAYDAIIFVIEPTLKSISVLNDFLKKFDTKISKIFIIGNKIFDNEDKQFILENISQKENDFPIVFFKNSETLKKFEQGDKDKFEEFYSQNIQQLRELEFKLNQVRIKDKKTYYKNVIKIHNKLATEWYNNYFNKDISIDIEKYTKENNFN